MVWRKTAVSEEPALFCLLAGVSFQGSHLLGAGGVLTRKLLLELPHQGGRLLLLLGLLQTLPGKL